MGARNALLLLACGATLAAGSHDTSIGHLGGVVIYPGQHNHTSAEATDGGAEMARHIGIPAIALVVGALMMLFAKATTGTADTPLGDVGKMTLYFGAQTGMNLYMKAVLSKSSVSPENNLEGMPAGFAVTGVQQITAFVLFSTWICFSKLTPCPYNPKELTSAMEWLAVIVFSLSFTLNIALNNYSLSLIPISTNLIIRSCLPLMTFVSQILVANITGSDGVQIQLVEVFFMLCGVACAALACYAEHAGDDSEDSGSFVFGCLVCIASLFSGSLNLALAGMLGTSVHLNALDTTVYMSVPAVIFLIVPTFFYSHTIKDDDWRDYVGSESTTDWTIFKDVCELNHFTVYLAVFSGALALAYNVLQYGIVQSLSAAHTAFAGNFNKAATIVLALLVGLEHLPEGGWGVIMLAAVFGNIASFTAYNFVKLRAKDTQHEAFTDDEEDYDSEEGEFAS